MHHWVLSWRMSATTRIQSKKRLWGHLICVFTLWLRRLTRVDWMSSVWSHDWYWIQGYRVMCWHPVKPWYFDLALCLPRESPYQVPTMPCTQILSIQRLTLQHRIMSAGHQLGVHSHSFNWHLWTEVSGNPPENAPLGIGCTWVVTGTVEANLGVWLALRHVEQGQVKKKNVTGPEAILAK